MSGRPWRTLVGLGVGALALAACTGPVPVHETPGWGDSIAAVQAELATIEPDPTPLDTPEPAEDPAAPLTTTSPNAVATAWTDLVVGQCVLWPYDEVGDMSDIVQVVPCEEPHYGELYATGVSGLETYGDAELSAEVDAACEAAFEDYVGVGYWQSAYYFDYTRPTQLGWDSGVRAWRCLVIEADYENSGSLRDVAR